MKLPKGDGDIRSRDTEMTPVVLAGVGKMAKMRAVQVSRPKGPLELVEREILDPGPGKVRIKDERQSPGSPGADHRELI